MGLVGQHRSARVGGGTELAEIRPFRTGDRLRRIHWPVSLRTGALHVTTTYADQDAEVRLVLDAIRDLGERDLETGRRSSLDVAVEAAGAVAAHYLTTGDRVGLSVLGGGGIVEVPAVGGHHQLARVLLGLGRAEPSRGTIGEERALRAQLRRSIPPGAFVVLLSALVSAEPLAHAVRLARSGHAVVVVDTLPPELLGDRGLRRRPALGDRRRRPPAGPARVAPAAARPRARGAPVRDGRCAGHRLAGARVARHRAAPGGPPLPRPEGGEPMIRNRTWRRAMVGTVLVADVVILLVAGAGLTGFLPFALVALAARHLVGAGPTRRGGVRSRSWSCRCSARPFPAGHRETLVQWALAAATGSAVVLTHLALTLLGSWPVRADLPRATALRWGGQAAALVWAAIGAALLGALATTTPLGWAPWIGAIGLGLIAGTVWQVRVNTRRV